MKHSICPLTLKIKPLTSPLQGYKDKDKDMVKSKDKDKTTKMLRVEKLVKRRESTKWSDKEIKALNNLDPSEEDIAFLESTNYVDHQYRRQDLITLLNNWSGEMDRMNAPSQANAFDPHKSILDQY